MEFNELNPVIGQSGKFRQLPGTFILACDYKFTAGPFLKSVFEHILPGKAFLLELKNGQFQVLRVKLDQPGWRVNVEDRFLYLQACGKDQVAELKQKASELHYLYMGGQIYYPKKEDILKYWSKPDDPFNDSKSYLAPVSRSIYLADLIKSTEVKIDSALELGCNVGRNLNHLSENLGLRVGGLEICEDAVKIGKANYPALQDAEFKLGDLVETIKTLPDNAYDLVYSMAVLMHLHPQIDPTFWHHITRVAKKMIITIENESSGSNRNWERKYKNIFEEQNWRQIKEDHDVKPLKTYIARVFVPK